MANVYLAEDQELGRSVAIKILDDRHAADEQFVERFRREAKNAASLSPPEHRRRLRPRRGRGHLLHRDGVPGRAHAQGAARPLRDPAAGQDRDRLHAPGPVRARLRAQVRTSSTATSSRTTCSSTPDGHVKVTDFGIARAAASQMTEAGSIIGTAQYLSPEQARGAPVDQRSDIYSVGVLLYELLTGAVPFTGDTPVEIAMKHLSAVPEQPSKKRPDAPARAGPRGRSRAGQGPGRPLPERRGDGRRAGADRAGLPRQRRDGGRCDRSARAGAGIDSTAVRKSPVVTTGAYRPPPGRFPPACAEATQVAVARSGAAALAGIAALVWFLVRPAVEHHGADVRPRAVRRGHRRAARDQEARRGRPRATRSFANRARTSPRAR